MGIYLPFVKRCEWEVFLMAESGSSYSHIWHFETHILQQVNIKQVGKDRVTDA